MGIVGMLVFIPIVSVLYALLRGDVYEHLEKRELLLTGNPVRYIGRRNRMWMKADTETKKWYTKTEFVKSQRMGRLCKRKYG